jgi:hypothetical protein
MNLSLLISHATNILAWKKSCDLILHYYCKLWINFQYNFWITPSNILPSNVFLLEYVSGSQTALLTRCLLLPMWTKNNCFLVTEKCLVLSNKIPYQTTDWSCQNFSSVYISDSSPCLRDTISLLQHKPISLLYREEQFIFCYFHHIWSLGS